MFKRIESKLEKTNICRFNGAKILITGASGVVGQALIRELSLRVNNSVTHVTAVCRRESAWLLDGLWDQNNLQVIYIDLSDQDFANNSHLRDKKFDLIIHAASYAQPNLYKSKQLETIHLNTGCIHSLMAMLNDRGTFCYLSSSDYYFNCEKLPYTEESLGIADSWHARSCYVESKRIGEVICKAYVDKGVDVKVIRLALGYGEGFRSNDARVLYEFIKSACDTKQITMRDNGQAPRTYIHTADVSTIITNIISGSRFPVYNVGGNERTTIYDLAGLVAKKTSSMLNMPGNTDLYQPDAPKDVWLDMSRYSSEFRFDRLIKLEDGIESCIRWYRYMISVSALQNDSELCL